MATTLNNFVSETQLTTTISTLESTASTEKKFLGAINLFNTSSSNVEVTLWRLDSATTETEGVGGNFSFKATIPANNSLKVFDVMSQVLDYDMKLSGKASVDNVVNIDISGSTET